MTTLSHYNENVQAAKRFLTDAVKDDPRSAFTPQLSVQVAQTHAMLAIAEALMALWTDCQCS